MTAYDRLDLLFQQNNGIVKTAQVLEIGIAKSTFYAYAKQRGVEQAAHGVYVSPDAWTDAMYPESMNLADKYPGVIAEFEKEMEKMHVPTPNWPLPGEF